jgi:hypothetical protein
MSGCDCVCHAGIDGLWRSHLCEHCAPGYFARRSAREHEHDKLRQAEHGTVHSAPSAKHGPDGHLASIKEHSL